MEITVVPNEYGTCPTCGSYAGNPDPKLNWPNRSKVQDEDGTWWWRCYNPECDTAYFDPATGVTQPILSPEEEAEIRRQSKEWAAGFEVASRTVEDGVETITLKRKGE